MLKPKSSNRRTHAQSTHQSMPEQTTGRPGSPDAVVSGTSSSFGVLSELAARPTKRSRTDASAVGSAPGLGAHPARNGTSMPFSSSAQAYDNLRLNSHVNDPQLWRADTAETIEQPSAFEDAAVHEEPRAPVDSSSTSCGTPSALFAQLKDTVQSGAGGAGFEIPYPADEKLIGRFKEGALEGGSQRVTVEKYANILTRFSDWLRKQHKGGLQDRLFTDKEALEHDASKFQEWIKRKSLPTILNYLRTVESTTHGTVTFRKFCRYKCTEGDEKLINDTLFAIPRYATALRAFSVWLHAEGKKGLSEPGRLHSQSLMDDAQAFAGTNVGISQISVAALHKLQTFKTTGAVAIKRNRSKISIPEIDRKLSEKFKNILVASGCENKYHVGAPYADRLVSALTHFSAWLKEEKKEAIALRLHDPTLYEDLNLYAVGKSNKQSNYLQRMLKKARKMCIPDVQLPDLGSRAEPSGSSYSPLLPPTASGSLPQRPESRWNLETLEEELMRPSFSPQLEASSSTFPFESTAVHQADGLPHALQSIWNLETLEEELMRPSFSPQP
ncbi:hypothetical protein [Xanthomonas fragariae]|uniref:hypothetical protein n=1 Tax=Xanthomonas fragariae TaxID=48664 RepID=UPI001ABE9999|nr:hypothetical protein [Xanthomonas fragariae]UKR52239.1 hypothetical protein K4A87_16745 [Xanthomonas fragariae]